MGQIFSQASLPLTAATVDNDKETKTSVSSSSCSSTIKECPEPGSDSGECGCDEDCEVTDSMTSRSTAGESLEGNCAVTDGECSQTLSSCGSFDGNDHYDGEGDDEFIRHDEVNPTISPPTVSSSEADLYLDALEDRMDENIPDVEGLQELGQVTMQTDDEELRQGDAAMLAVHGVDDPPSPMETNDVSTDPQFQPNGITKRGRPSTVIPGHIKIVIGKNGTFYQCLCSKVFRTKQNIHYHRFCNSLAEKPCTCPICSCVCTTKSLLNCHMKEAHQHIGTYTCNVCKKCFSRKQRLAEHVLTHSGKRPWSCTVCERKFASKDSLRTHMGNHAPRISDYKCEVCLKTFTSDVHLKKHLTIHNPTFRYPCNICGKAFKSKQSAKMHEVLHHKVVRINPDTNAVALVFQYQCQFQHCLKVFASENTLSRHSKLHTPGGTVKGIKCEFCLKRFTRRDNVRRHMKAVHTEKK